MAQQPTFPPEVRLMIWEELLKDDLAPPPRVYQLKCTKDPATGSCKLDVYGEKIKQVLLHISYETASLAAQHYVRILDVDPDKVGVQANTSSGGLWIRRKDIVYLCVAGASHLDDFTRANLQNVERLAVDVVVLNAKYAGWAHGMEKVLAFFPSLKHLVFFAPTKPNPRKNYYRGLRLVDMAEDDAAKELPIARFYNVGDNGSGLEESAGWPGVRIHKRQGNLGETSTILDLRVGQTDRLRLAIRHLGTVPVIIFQRQGALEPTRQAATGPPAGHYPTSALGFTHYRARPVLLSADELLALMNSSSLP